MMSHTDAVGTDVIVEPIDKGTDKRMTVPECGTYVYSETTKLRIKETEIDGSFKISREKHVASFDATKVKFPIKIRKTAEGDWFVPFGMNGKKLISDYLTSKWVLPSSLWYITIFPLLLSSILFTISLSPYWVNMF